MGETLEHDYLGRIARSLECIEKHVVAAAKPLILQRMKAERELKYAWRRLWWEWVDRAVAIRGPIPEIVSRALWDQFRRRFITLVFRDVHVYTLPQKGSAFLYASWGEPPNDPGNLYGFPQPPCGPKSKTRAEYNKWLKRRVRKRKENASTTLRLGPAGEKG